MQGYISETNRVLSPDVLDIEPSQFLGCQPLSVQFRYLGIGLDSTYTFVWDFGDGNVSNEQNPVHVYNDAGSFLAELSVESLTGCHVNGNVANEVTVKDSPNADAYVTPDELSFTNPTINIVNESSGGQYYFWEFGDGGISYDFEPEYTYQDTGIYIITYILTSENFCTDTLLLKADISPEIDILYPNAFTPNSDGVNDEFYGKRVLDKLIFNYDLKIYDRWGGLVFKTTNIDEFCMVIDLIPGIFTTGCLCLRLFILYGKR
ncbi:MAG: PKD domain-containing protein [Saprospiraceae bacterium]